MSSSFLVFGAGAWGTALSIQLMKSKNTVFLSSFDEENLYQIKKDQENKKLTFLAGDIFISLSDNIQETFGLTPLEGMASGLPVIVSDWNGYKDTVKDKENGFRIKTISLNEGYGEDIAYSHMMGALNYDHYIGYASQRIAIDVKDCIEKYNQ